MGNLVHPYHSKRGLTLSVGIIMSFSLTIMHTASPSYLELSDISYINIDACFCSNHGDFYATFFIYPLGFVVPLKV